MVEMDEVYQKDANFVSRRVVGETVLVPIRRKKADLDCIYSLNETAAYTWENFNGVLSLSEICDRIVAAYSITSQEASQDLLELVTNLSEIGAIELVQKPPVEAG
jgi:hypothetical protein